MLLAGGKESSQLEKWSEHSVSVQAHPTAETATLPSNHLGFNSSLIDLMEGSIANTSPRTHRGAELALAPPPPVPWLARRSWPTYIWTRKRRRHG